jgi:hypothetical protein
LPKWEEIVNPPECEGYATNAEHFMREEFCKRKSIAVIMSANQFYEDQSKCKTMELIGDQYLKMEFGSILIHCSFKYKEQVRQKYIKMMETGIVARINRHYGNIKNGRNFQKHYDEPYKVHIFGVTFEHVHLIVKGFFLLLLIGPIVCCCEIVHHKFAQN